jgi:hypothetical protein
LRYPALDVIFLAAVKTLSLEDIYADPHKLDAILDAGEAVALVRDGRAVGEFVPRKVGAKGPEVRPTVDYKARFLRMWGTEAFASKRSVADDFAEMRSRNL